ncbi:WXG100 family type VII secretion target [Actinoplanes sp. NPDC051851]|uniref:WXG100 family type VII secretion target n=1 Tax=Actinoplanes sp. NPDC051851 TaxID=3154753 RepID=UPI0034390155
MSSSPDYDIVTRIEVQGAAMQTAATALKTQATNVADGITAINNALDSLKLGWAGASASEASDFIDRWNATAVALFGTEESNEDEEFNDADGVLNVLAGGLEAVLDGFNKAESEITRNFRNLYAGLTPATGDDPIGGGTSTADPGSDPVITTTG